MMKPLILTVCAVLALSSTQAIGAPDVEELDEITIRVLSNDDLPDSVSDIELPEIGEKHEVELPDNANDAARQRSNNAANAASESANNAADAAQDAADNAREHAADAAEKGLNRAPGQNK